MKGHEREMMCTEMLRVRGGGWGVGSGSWAGLRGSVAIYFRLFLCVFLYKII